MAASWSWLVSLSLLLSASLCSAYVSFPNINKAVKLKLDNPFVDTDHSFITVSWSGVPKPTAQDAIIQYVPHDAEVGYTIPARYIWVNKVSTWRSGSGKYRFKVLNQRADGIFYYFYNVSIGYNGQVDPLENAPVTGFLPENVIARSEKYLTNKLYPTQAHLSFTKVAGEVIVQWTTATKFNGAPFVKYGTSHKSLQKSGKGKTVTYTRKTLCGAPANDTGYIFPGYFHQVLLSGLAPNTKYFYRVLGSTFQESKLYKFTTPPLPGPDASVRMIAWADSGQATSDHTDEWEWSDYDPVVTVSQNTTEGAVAMLTDVWQQDQAEQGASLNLSRRITKELDGVTLLMHNGDISYARGSVTQWDTFMDQYKVMFSQVPYMTCPGNHERDFPNTGDRYWPLHAAYDSGGECGKAYELRFAMPLPEPGQQWYSFDYGPIHFIQLSTEQSFADGSPQWLFLNLDLAKVNRTFTPWVVVGFHRPIYTTSIYGHEFQSDLNVANDLQTSLEKIFFLYEVDMTWVGHVHLYARTCPVLQKTCLGWNADGTPAAPIHMSMGHGGFEFTWFMNPTPPDYFDAVYIEHGYMRVEANATSLHITGVSSDTGDVMDDFVLTKPKGWKPQGFKAKKAFLDLFISNYTAVSPFEYPGVSSNTLWGEPLYAPVATILENNKTLLDQILAHKPDFMVNINVGDTVKNLADLFKYYYQEFHSAAYHSAIPAGQENVANAYLNGLIYPLLEFFFNNSAYAQTHPSFDAGTVVAPKNQGAPGTKTTPIYP